MPHFVNIDGMHESLFLLQQLRVASQQYCEKHSILRGESEESAIGWDYYAGMLKSSVCDHLIQISIKLRILQDIVREVDHSHIEDGFSIERVDEDARDGLIIGQDASGSGLSVREACNKILHATETTLEWSESSDPPYEYWTGRVKLQGRYRKEEWTINMDVEAFSLAAFRYLRDIEDQVDLPRLYKHDE